MGLDAATFDAIYAANADRIYSTAYRMLGDPDAAADVVQDTFLKAYTATDEIREPAAWLTTVARNNALNVLRRTGRLAPLAEEAVDDDEPAAPPLVADEPAADPLRAAATADALAIVDELLASLSPAQRTALLLFHAQEQPISAIAEALGRTVNATTVFLHRSRAALRSRYADRVYGRMNVPPECLAFRPELLAHVEGKPAAQAYLDHLPVDPVCQAIEAELRGMGRVLGVLPIVPAPAGLQVSVEAALAAETAGAVATGGTSGATTSGGAPATTSTTSQASHGAGGFLSTAAGKVAVGVATLAIVVTGALVVLQQPPPEPAPVALAAVPVLSTYDSHACAIRDDGTLACWGSDTNRKLDVPEGEFTAVSAGQSLSCAIRTDGAIACWGYDANNETDAPEGTFVAVSTGSQHTCAIRTDGTLACWGWNLHGQADPPVGEFRDVAAGWMQSCAIRTDDSVICWGDNDYGHVHGRLQPDGTIREGDAPAGAFRTLTAGHSGTCGIRVEGTLECWGVLAWNFRDGVPEGQYVTVEIGVGNAVCAIRTDGGIDCWTSDVDPLITDTPEGQYRALAVGLGFACALRTDGNTVCWGHNIGDRDLDPPPGRYGPTGD